MAILKFSRLIWITFPVKTNDNTFWDITKTSIFAHFAAFYQNKEDNVLKNKVLSLVTFKYLRSCKVQKKGLISQFWETSATDNRQNRRTCEWKDEPECIVERQTCWKAKGKKKILKNTAFILCNYFQIIFKTFDTFDVIRPKTHIPAEYTKYLVKIH